MIIRKKVRFKTTLQIISIDTSSFTKDVFCEFEGCSFDPPQLVQILQGAIQVKVSEKCLNRELIVAVHISEKTKSPIPIKSTAKKIAIAFAFSVVSFGFSAVFAYIDAKLNEGKVIEWTSNIVRKEAKLTIESNDHVIYNTDKFKELEKDYIERFKLSSSVKVKEIFQNIGDGNFLMKDIVRYPDGVPYIDSRKRASGYCEENFDGELPDEETHKLIQAASYLKSKKSRIKKATNVSEWSITEYDDDDDYYYIEDKGLSLKGEPIKKVGGKTYGEEDKMGLGFRCVINYDSFD